MVNYKFAATTILLTALPSGSYGFSPLVLSSRGVATPATTAVGGGDIGISRNNHNRGVRRKGQI